MTRDVVVAEFPAMEGGVMPASLYLTVLRDFYTGEVKPGVREFTIRVSADGVAEVTTVELTGEDGRPITGGDEVVTGPDGQLAEARFTYVLAGVRVRGGR